jgi:RNase H-fold protein (predicted Holliday junction resolvase)
VSTLVTPRPPILALDPGREKCGIAIVSRHLSQLQVLVRRVVPSSEVERMLPELMKQWQVKRIVLGDATSSRDWRERLQKLVPDFDLVLVEEAGSTLEARALYWKENRPRGWRRALPLSLQTPPEPIDDFAAVVLAERYFDSEVAEA